MIIIYYVELRDLSGQKFTRLTIIKQASKPKNYKYSGAWWKCLCDCGKIIIAKSGVITSGETKSCGCLFESKKRPHNEGTAHRIWRARYRELPFDIAFNLFQQNCVYCDLPPSNERKSRRKPYPIFKFSGIDRINSQLDHIPENVVPACQKCNHAKSDYSIEEFNDKIYNLISNKQIRTSPVEYREKAKIINTDILNDKNMTSYRTSMRNIKNFYNEKSKDGYMSEEVFYQLSQLNCYYCNCIPSGCYNRAKTRNKSSQYSKDTGTFIYNGLDRIDSNISHYYENVVPCCYHCNIAKNDLTLDEFDAWIDRLAAHRSNMLSYFQSRGYLLNIKL